MPLLTIEQLPTRTGEISSVGAYGFMKQWRALAPGPLYHQGQVLNSFYAQTGVWIGSPWIIGGYGDPHYEAVNLWCTRLRADETQQELFADGSKEWTITATFEPADPILLTVDAIQPVASESPIRITHGEWTESYTVWRDKDGNVIQNSAGDWFAEPTDTERHFPMLSIVRYERSFNPLVAGDYRDHVNSVDWTVRGVTYPARMAKCVSITAPNQLYHQDVGTYYEVAYQFAIRNLTWADGQGWDLEVANTGYREKSGAALLPILDGSGMPTQRPWPLDATTGAKLSVPLTAGVDMPTKTFKIELEADFNALGFPTT
jgi:hypothetical protein